MYRKKDKNLQNEIKFVCLEQLVPEEHILREIEEAIDWKCMITAGQINLSDGTSIHNRGVLPTIFVETSFEDTKNGIDKILETAMNHLS